MLLTPLTALYRPVFNHPAIRPCRYLELDPDSFFSRAQPRPLLNPKLLTWNRQLATELGLKASDFEAHHFTQRLADPALPEQLQPLAMAYSGHQFGQFNPSLGDGRALLIGELQDRTGQPHEVQLKGSGPTPYSRGFDGRAVMRSVVREYLASEALAALDIPTTRALAIVASETPVFREQPEQGALMIRTAPSHLRFGSFEHFTARGQLEQLKQLADFCIKHYFTDLLDHNEPYAHWFEQIVQSTAQLMAQWQAAGFCHGVMNTDNFSVLGLTLDYGPYGFLETYDPQHICNHSDSEGRYAFGRQPAIGYWNCLCLAQALSPLLSEAQIKAALKIYEPTLQSHYLRLMQTKLGLRPTQSDEDQQDDEVLIAALLTLMERQQLDYSRFLRGLGYWLDAEHEEEVDPWLFQQRQAQPIQDWLAQYRRHLDQRQDGLGDQQRARQMRQSNPKYILRNHLAQQAIEFAEQGDSDELNRLLTLLRRPFDEHPAFSDYANPRPKTIAPICVSCSS